MSGQNRLWPESVFDRLESRKLVDNIKMKFLASLCLPGLGFEMVKGAKHATDFSGHVNLAATIRTNLGLKQFRHPPNYLDCLEFGGARACI